MVQITKARIIESVKTLCSRPLRSVLIIYKVPPYSIICNHMFTLYKKKKWIYFFKLQILLPYVQVRCIIRIIETPTKTDRKLLR